MAKRYWRKLSWIGKGREVALGADIGYKKIHSKDETASNGELHIQGTSEFSCKREAVTVDGSQRFG